MFNLTSDYVYHKPVELTFRTPREKKVMMLLKVFMSKPAFTFANLNFHIYIGLFLINVSTTLKRGHKI